MWDERWFAGALLEFADTLGTQFDEAEFTKRLAVRCAELTGEDSTGVALTGSGNELRVAAARDHTSEVLQGVQIKDQTGPSVACHRTGRAVRLSDMSVVRRRWPVFGRACAEAGVRGVHAVPLRRDGQGVGAVSLFLTRHGVLGVSIADALEALAGAAAIGLLQQRSRHDNEVRVAQLQEALDRRIVLEQAKGVLAERLHLSPGDAFERMRRYARSHHRRLHDVAAAVVASPSGSDPLRLSTPDRLRSVARR